MIEWLVQQSLIVSFLILFLLAAKLTLSQHFSAFIAYIAWAVLPLTIALSSVMDFNTVVPGLAKFTVSVSKPSQQIATALELSELALFIWLPGSALLLCLLLFSYLRFNQRQALWQQNCSEINFSGTTYQVKTAAEHSSPFVVGFLFPVIVLPEDFHSRYSKEQQELILRHEQIHVNRGDLWWNLLAQCLVALFWFNPLVWLAYQHFRQAQELACDETVIGGAPASLKVEYAHALLCTSTSKEISPHLIHYGDKSMLKDRLNRVMNQVQSKRWKNIIAVIMLSLVTLSATLAAAGNYDSSGVSGVPLKRFEPVDPAEAAKQGIEGSVTLRFDIETDGSVSNVSVIEARPHKIFDKSAKTALRKWLYEKPQTRLEGVRVQLDFVLSDEGSQLSIRNHDNKNELVLVENHN